MTPVTATAPPLLARQYPHVDGVTDWRAQQSLRLLWDRYFDLAARLQGLEGTVDTLVAAVNRAADALTRVDHKVDEALALAQLVRADVGRGAGTGEGPGEPTLPDYLSVVTTVLARYNPVVAVADEEAAKAQLTRAVAWEIYQTDPAIGLLQKTTGNQIAGLSVDLVVQQSNGDFADVASSTSSGAGMVTILAIWIPHAGDGSLIPRWIEPTAALAAMAGPMAPA